jgi:serine/threonine protein kinase/tetratricopeptide (TPR) repeat protein
MVEAIWADQRRRWQSGQGVAARRYLEEYATLAADSEVAADLVYHEFIVREELGTAPPFEEYVAEYALYAARLRDLHEADHLVKLPVPPAKAVLRPPERLGDYELLEEIGRGGMGVVYRARQVSLNRIVAVKMLLAGQRAAEALRQRFRQEAEAAGHLQHPHIVAVHEVGEQDGQPYFSMDYIEGKSLAALVRENLLPPATAAAYVKTIALAIHYAHQQGTLHRDLKPANVLIDACGQPRITDFGIAKRIAADSQLTATGEVLGTPSYMAPEQAAGKVGQIGPASDIYAMGAILYELLTGRPPFRADTPFDTLRQVVETDAASLRLLNPKVPRDLETICRKCLEKEPGKRYPNGQALADDLERFLKGEPIRARPPRAWERGLKWAKRRPALAALAAVCVAAVLTVLVVILVSNARLEQERDYADEKRLEAEAQRQQALANFRKARAAVDELLTQVGHSDLVSVPYMEKVRRNLLQAAARYYREFVQQAGADPEVRHETGRAYRRLARLNGDLGEKDKAVAALREALAIDQKLAAEFPDRPAYRKELANCRCDLGTLLTDKSRQEAEAMLRQALDMQRRLLAEYPNESDYRVDLGGAYQRLGILLKNSGRHAEAEQAFRRAVELLEVAVARSPTKASYEEELDIHRSNFAVLLAKEGRFAEAQVYFRQNRDFWAKRLAQDPSAVNNRSKLARSQHLLGLALRDLGRPQEAEPAIREAIRLRRGLVEDFPKMPYGHFALGDVLHQLAKVVFNRGDHAEARQLLEQAVAQTKTAVQLAPGTEQYLHSLRDRYAALTEALLRLQAPGEAAKVAAELPPLFPKDPTGYVLAVRLLARCAVLAEKVPELPESERRRLAQACADQAVPLLRKAIRLGYKEIDRLSASPQLDQASKKLLAEWVEKAKQS